MVSNGLGWFPTAWDTPFQARKTHYFGGKTKTFFDNRNDYSKKVVSPSAVFVWGYTRKTGLTDFKKLVTNVANLNCILAVSLHPCKV